MNDQERAEIEKLAATIAALEGLQISDHAHIVPMLRHERAKLRALTKTISDRLEAAGELQK